MSVERTTKFASLIVIATGILWGFYWLPVRQMEALGLAGPWGTAVIAAASVAGLTPFALRYWRAATGPHRMTRWALIMGGGAFALYSIGFIYGRVALVILLFFLTPVWSTLIARYVMGWHTPVLRYVAIGFGLCGLSLMLSAGGCAGAQVAGRMVWADFGGVLVGNDDGPAGQARATAGFGGVAVFAWGAGHGAVSCGGVGADAGRRDARADRVGDWNRMDLVGRFDCGAVVGHGTIGPRACWHFVDGRSADRDGRCRAFGG